MNVDLARVLALDAAAKPGPWGTAIYLGRKDRDLIAFFRVAAPEMARTLKELRELAMEVIDPPDIGALAMTPDGLVDAVLRVTAPPDEAEAT